MLPMKLSQVCIFLSFLWQANSQAKVQDTVKTVGAQTNVQATVKKVLDLLETMLEQSRSEGTTERKKFFKYKCDCDKNTALRESQVKELTHNIAKEESELEVLRGENGELSQILMEKEKENRTKTTERDEAESNLRRAEEEYNDVKGELNKAIGQLDSAVSILAAAGYDNTGEDDAAVADGDHANFTAGFDSESNLLQMKSVKEILKEVSYFMTPAQRSLVSAFIQQPNKYFGSSKTAEILGMLKQMQLDFVDDNRTNLVQWQKTSESLNALISNLNTALSDIEKLLDRKRGDLADNDQAIVMWDKYLTQDTADLKQVQDFWKLEKKDCADVAADYAVRVKFRSAEQVSISKTIEILSSDEAFAVFHATGGVSEHSAVLNFLQMGAPRKTADATMTKKKTTFGAILRHVESMIGVIDDEIATDKEKNATCVETRAKKKNNIATLSMSIVENNRVIDECDTLISNAKSDINLAREQIEGWEEDMVTSRKNRAEANAAWKKTVSENSGSWSVLDRALQVLKKHFSSFVQAPKVDASEWRGEHDRVDPSPMKKEKTWSSTDDFHTDRLNHAEPIGLLGGVISEVRQNILEANLDETREQRLYERKFQTTKFIIEENKRHIKKRMADLESEEARKTKEEADKKENEVERAREEKYLNDIAPGCDFIEDEIVERTQANIDQKREFQNFIKVIKSTPIYEEEQDLRDHNAEVDRISDASVGSRKVGGETERMS